MKVYPNIQEAKQAQSEFLKRLSELEKAYGVELDCDDSCAQIYYKIKYLDKNGFQVTLY